MSALTKDYINGLLEGTGTTIDGGNVIALLVASTGTGSFSQAAFVDAEFADEITSTAMLRHSTLTANEKSINGVNASFITCAAINNTDGVISTTTTSDDFVGPDVDVAGLTYDKVVLVRWGATDTVSPLIAYLDTTGGVQANNANVTLTLPVSGNLFQIPTTA